MTYWRGYAIDAGPKDIEQLLIDLVSLRLNLQGTEGLASEAIGGYSYTRAAATDFEDGDLRRLPTALATINAWRRVLV